MFLKSLKVFFTIFPLFIFAKLYSQSPGGVSSNFRLWLKGNSGVTLTAGLVTQWNDNTSGANNATGGASPAYVTSGSDLFNYNQVLSFSGVHYLNLNAAKNPMGSGTEARTFYTVQKTVTGVTTAGDNGPVMAQGTSTTGLGAVNQGRHMRLLVTSDELRFDTDGRTRGISQSNANPGIITWTLPAGESQVLTNGAMYYNSKPLGAFTLDQGVANFSINTGSNLAHVGKRAGTSLPDEFFKGFIGELITYNGIVHSGASKNQIESYLAIKYGITLDRTSIGGIYLNSASGWIYANSGTYWNDIIGIGRDDNSGLLQKQSHQQNDLTRIYLSTLQTNNSSNSGTFSSNYQYVVMGHNNGMLMSRGLSDTEYPTGLGIFSRIEREWQVTNSGFTGTFNLDFKLSTTPINPAHLRLLVDDDGNFTNATMVSGVTFSYSGGVVTASGVSNSHIPANSTRFITLVSLNSATPLPVTLTDFYLSKTSDNKVIVNWKTAGNNNHDYFEIERGTDGNYFEKIGEKEGSINTSSYLFKDDNPVYNTGVYYRLKMFDAEGAVSYSGTEYILLKDESLVRVFPNPSTGKFTVSTTTSGVMKLTDASGRVLNVDFVRNASAQEITFDISHLTSGIYFLKVGMIRKIIYKY
jgi:hypothetical protein